jgi:hypothetical protein
MEVAAGISLAKSPTLGGVAKVMIPSLMIILLILIGWSKFGPLKRPLPATGPSQAPSIAAGNTPWMQQQTEGVRSTLKSDGFTPSSATCAAGQVQLIVENVSGTAPLTLRLARANGEVVGEYQLEKYFLKQDVNLPPGAYTLKEVNHSAWVLQISVQ